MSRARQRPPWAREPDAWGGDADPDAPLITWRGRRNAGERQPGRDADLVAPSSVDRVARDWVRLGQSYVRCFAVLALPRQLRPGALSAICRLPGVRTALVNNPLPRHLAKERLAAQIRQMGASLHHAGEEVADETLALRDMRRQLAALAEEQTGHHLIGLYLSVFGADLAELGARTRALRDACTDAQIRVVALDYAQWEGALTAAPLGHDLVRVLSETDTPTIARLTPSSPASLGATPGAPILYGLRADSQAAHGGVPVLLDRFQLPSPHQAVIAATGGGKSYWQHLTLLQRFAHGNCDICVLDPKGQEYRSLIERALGGAYLVLSEQSPVRMNPLALPTGEAAAARLQALGMDLPAARASLVKQLAVGEANARGAPLSGRAEAQLEEAVAGCYRARGITHDPATFHAEPPTLRDVARTLEERGCEEALCELFEVFVGGRLGRLIGGAGTLPLGVPTSSLRSDVGVLGIDLGAFVQGGDATLQRVLPPLIASHFVTIAMVGGGRPMEVVIDEAWTLLATEAGSAMLETIARVGRSLQVAATVITQQVREFITRRAGDAVVANEAGKTFLDNCETVLLLRQLRADRAGEAASDHPVVMAARHFALAPSEQRWLAQCGRDEGGATGLLLIGREPVRLRVPRAPAELHRLITDPDSVLGEEGLRAP